MKRYAPSLIALGFLTAAATPACLEDSQKTGTTASLDATSELAPDSLAEAEVTPPICRTYASAWEFPDTGRTGDCTFDTAAFTRTCSTVDGPLTYAAVDHFPSLEAFVAAREIGVIAHTKTVSTDADGKVSTTELEFDTSGKTVGSAVTSDGELQADTTMTQWDSKGRWISATVTTTWNDCSSEWTRAIDDVARTITTARAETACAFPLVERATFDENGMLIYSESGSTVAELSGGDVTIVESTKVCLP